jgi:hypothetical protein
MGTPKRRIITIPDWMFAHGVIKMKKAQQKAGHEGGLNLSKITSIMCSNLFIDKATIESDLGMEPDDIDAAIGESIRLCLEVLDGEAKTLDMKGE